MLLILVPVFENTTALNAQRRLLAIREVISSVTVALTRLHIKNLDNRKLSKSIYVKYLLIHCYIIMALKCAMLLLYYSEGTGHSTAARVQIWDS